MNFFIMRKRQENTRYLSTCIPMISHKALPTLSFGGLTSQALRIQQASNTKPLLLKEIGSTPLHLFPTQTIQGCDFNSRAAKL